MNPNKRTLTRVFLVTVPISILIFIFLVWWIYYKEVSQGGGAWTTFLPYLNCTLNTLTSILLILGFKAIKSGQKERHRSLMISAGISSAVFLVSYLTYHHFQGDTKFMGLGVIKYAYFFILITHVILSMVQVPLILGTYYLAFTKKWATHKKVARITFPIWLYVSVTGVLVFIFLKLFNN